MQFHTFLSKIISEFIPRMMTQIHFQMAHTVREGLNLAEELWESHDTDMSVRAAFQSIGWYPKTALQKALEWLHFDYYLGDVPRVSILWFLVIA